MKTITKEQLDVLIESEVDKAIAKRYLNEADQNTNNVWNFVKPISKNAMSKIGNKAAFAIISDYLYTFLAKHKEHANTPIGQALSKLAYSAAKRAK